MPNEKDMRERTLNVRDMNHYLAKERAEKKNARNTFVTPVFERSGKD